MDRLADSPRRERLELWLTGDLRDRFGGRVLPVDATVADEWGRLLAQAEKAGTAIAGIDALIAATARVHGLQVVTRNIVHFQYTGVEVISPWVRRSPHGYAWAHGP